MATTSFNKEFVVTDEKSIQRIRWDLAHPRRVVIKRRNYSADSKKGIKLFTQAPIWWSENSVVLTPIQ